MAEFVVPNFSQCCNFTGIDVGAIWYDLKGHIVEMSKNFESNEECFWVTESSMKHSLVLNFTKYPLSTCAPIDSKLGLSPCTYKAYVIAFISLFGNLTIMFPFP